MAVIINHSLKKQSSYLFSSVFAPGLNYSLKIQNVFVRPETVFLNVSHNTVSILAISGKVGGLQEKNKSNFSNEYNFYLKTQGKRSGFHD